MDANGFRKSVVSATKYMAFFNKTVCTFREPIEVEDYKGKKMKVVPTICFMEVFEGDDNYTKEEPRFSLDEDSICYGCSNYKHINDVDAPNEVIEDDIDENKGVCDCKVPCICGSLNDYSMDD